MRAPHRLFQAFWLDDEEIIVKTCPDCQLQIKKVTWTLY
jgi:hypothetical protein